MKAIIPILALSTGLLLAISLAQWHRSSGLRQQLAGLSADNEDKGRQVDELKAERTRQERQRAELSQTAAELQEQVRTQTLAASQAPTGALAAATTATNVETKTNKPGFGNFLSKMMQDPDAKKFIRDQQRMMMDQMYAPLIKQLGLSTEEAAQFKDLLADNTMKAAEKATSMFGAPAGGRSELAANMAEEQKAFDEQIKTFLGEERFPKYKEYQETVGDRTQLSLYRQQNPGDYAINDVQTEQLLTLIKEERRSVAAATGQNAVPGPDNKQNLDAMLSSEQADKLLQSQEMVNQRVLERARMVLSPDQLQSFGAFQTNQMQTMRMGMGMMRKLLNGEEAQAPAVGMGGNP